MGLVFPALLKWIGREQRSLGTDVGTLYAVNTASSVLGAFVAGFVLIATIGVNTGLLLLAALYGATSLLLVSSKPARLVSGLVVMVIAGLVLNPEIRAPRYWYNGGFTQAFAVPEANTAFLEEGVTATVGIVQNGSERQLTVNGVIVAQTKEHDLWDLLSKAHLPMLIHPNPKRVALVGLGAGVSLGAVEKYDVDVLDCIEISPEVVRACRLFERVNQDCLADPRLNLILNDGRHFLETTDKEYDVINVDPTDPPVCPLYTQDFFHACKNRLADGGLMVQWVPVFRLSPDNIAIVFNAFLQEFSSTSIWYNGTAALLIGRKGGPISINLQRFIARANSPGVRESLALIGNPDPWMLLAMYVGDASKFLEQHTAPIPENTDDRPFLEYTVLRSPDAMRAKEYWTLKMLAGLGTPIERVLDPGAVVPSFQTEFYRMRTITNSFFSARLRLFEGNNQEARALVERTITGLKVTPEELRCLDHFYSLGVQ